MACDLQNVIYGNTCTESYGGTGMQIKLFLPPETAPTYDDKKNQFSADAFTGVKAKTITVKKSSGEVTWNFNGNNAGWTAAFSGLIDADINAMAVNNRTLGNLGGMFGVAVPVGTTDEGTPIYDIIYDHTYGVALEVSGTTGKEATDEKGHTFTVTCSTMKYGPTQWIGNFTEWSDTPAEG